MKVLFLSDYFSTWDIGGATRVLDGLWSALRDGGVECELVSGYPGVDGKEESREGWYRVPYKKTGYLIRLFLLIQERCREFKPDVIHVHQPLIGAIACFAAPRNIPKIYHFHSLWAEEKRNHGKGLMWNALCGIKARVERFCLERMDEFIVLSRFSAEKLKRYCKDKTVHELPGGVDLKKFPFSERRMNNGNFAFLSLRRLEPRMGLDLLIRAFEKTGREIGASLTLVGRGREEANLRKLIRELKLEEKVTLTGGVSQEELRRLFAEHDCMVIPTRTMEGFGMVVVESLASGLPVLATNAGALGEFSRHGEVFECVGEPDVDNLSRGLRVAEDRFRNRELRKTARKIAEAMYDNTVLAKQLKSIYESLL